MITDLCLKLFKGINERKLGESRISNVKPFLELTEQRHDNKNEGTT